MPAFIVFIVVALIVSISGVLDQKDIFPSLASISQIYQERNEKGPETNSGAVVVLKEKYQPKPDITPQEEPPVPEVLINTYITSGPRNKEVIDNTNKVTFKFKAKVSPEETEGRIYFETKVEGFDDNWKKTYSSQRTINLPLGPEEYTFLVRAKIKDFVDLTPAKRKFKINISPYFEKIRVSDKSPTLTSYLGKDEEINITGWRIKGKKGNIIIPQGIEVYLPNDQSSLEDIFVKRSDKVYILSSSNPMGINKNFRPNKCFGFLASKYEFHSSLSFSKKCPKIEIEDISHLSEVCQDFVLKEMKNCKIPDYSNNFKISLDLNCQSYINTYVAENLNYQGCLENYSNDEDFLEKKWYIFIGRDITREHHDLIYLYDKDGLVIDKYLY